MLKSHPSVIDEIIKVPKFAPIVFEGYNMDDIEITGITIEILILLCWQSDAGFDLSLAALDAY